MGNPKRIDDLHLDEDRLPQFRIGEYSRKMGVTPDFLKHYEQHRLVTSIPRDNGYRYYPFRQSFKILECLRLRGYGIPVREMSVMLNDDDADEVMLKLSERTRKLQQQIRFDEAVVEEHRRFSDFYSRTKLSGEYWQIAHTEEMIFLPHTQQYDFLEDERIYEILESWQNLMPMVKSCMRIPAGGFGRQDRPDFHWGLIVPKRIALQFDLPLNDAVIALPPRKLFLYDFCCTETPHLHYYSTYHRRVYEKMSQMGLSPTGDIHMVVHMYTNINSSLQCYGTYAVPID